MKNYPNKVYLSSSWHEAEEALSNYILDMLIANGLTVVGDEPEYKSNDPFKREWTSRILQNVSDCSALVIVFPKREEIQTTSPFIFPELLAADECGIPILVFHEQGVVIEKTATELGNELHFGSKNIGESLTYQELFVEYDANNEIDKKLNTYSTIKINKTAVLEGPFAIPDNSVNIKQIVSDFVNFKIKRVQGRYVFNVLPFSLKQKEHVEIAKAVFEETGLPCRISLDSIGELQSMRKQWREALARSEFVIAEFSELRDTCLFEAGVVMGMGKKVFLIAKKEPNLPYGLDDAPLKLYGSTKELREIVKTDFCAEYKRKVYNFDRQPSGQEGTQGGIPDWYYEQNESHNPLSKLTWSSWFFSIAIALFGLSALVSLGATDSVVSLLGLALSFIFGIGAHLRVIRTYFESKYIDSANYFFAGSLVLLLSSIVTLCVVYGLLPSPVAVFSPN